MLDSKGEVVPFLGPLVIEWSALQVFHYGSLYVGYNSPHKASALRHFLSPIAVMGMSGLERNLIFWFLELELLVGQC